METYEATFITVAVVEGEAGGEFLLVMNIIPV